VPLASIIEINVAGTTLSPSNHGVDIALSVQVWKEGASQFAYTPELDISSWGKTAGQAKSHLREAVSLFIEEAARQGTLDDILEEAGFERGGKTYRRRPIVARERMRLTLPAA
jgi:predicted Zn-dependent protease